MKMRSIIVILLILVASMITMDKLVEPEKEDTSPIQIEPPDTDNDGMNDWFEENVTDLDPNIPNERYLLAVASWENSEPGSSHFVPFEPINYNGGWFNGSRYLLMKNGFKPENIVLLLGSDATNLSFEREVSRLIEKVTENDTVFIQFSGHGSSEGFHFHNEHRSYEYIDEVIDRIIAKKVIISIASCFAGDPETIEPLFEGPCPRVIMSACEFTKYNNLQYGLWKKALNMGIDDMDTDSNGHISIKENWIARTEQSYEIMKKDDDDNWSYTLEENNGSLFCKVWSEQHQNFWYGTFFDTDDIGKHTYIGDATIEELKEKLDTQVQR